MRRPFGLHGRLEEPAFPVSIEDLISHLPDVTTPLVLVLRSAVGRILDAHKPIPENLSRRDARWSAAPRLS